VTECTLFDLDHDSSYRTSNWTHCATLRRHPCLSRVATSFSSQVNPIFYRGLCWPCPPLQFVCGRFGSPLYSEISQYSVCCGMPIWPPRRSNGRPYVFALFLLLLFIFHFFYPKSNSGPRSKLGRRTIFTWKELRPNFSEIHRWV